MISRAQARSGVEIFEKVITILIGLALGLFLALRHRWQQPPDQQPLTSTTSVTHEIAPDAETLTGRLHRLEGIISPLTSNLAHPRELEDESSFTDAVALLQNPDVTLETVMQYASGTNWVLACMALAALRKRGDGSQMVDQVQAQFDKLYPWPMYFALAYFASLERRPPVGAAAVGAKDWWGENQVIPILFRDYFAQRQRMGDVPSFGAAMHEAYASPPASIKDFLRRVIHPYAADLTRLLDDIQRSSVDRGFLTSFGRFWSDMADADVLVEPEPWQGALAAAQMVSLQTPTRPLLVSGDNRVGKTAFLRLLHKRLEEGGWSVFEASGADLMAGQQWFGQLEGRIQRTIEELAISKKLIWYIPDMLQLAHSGTHQGQAASILDQILPAVAGGRLIVWTEATPTSTARLLQSRPTVRSTFELIRLEPQSPEDTCDLAQGVIQRLSTDVNLKVQADCVAVALNSARQYLGAANLPGPVLDLIKATIGRTLKPAVTRSHRTRWS